MTNHIKRYPLFHSKEPLRDSTISLFFHILLWWNKVLSIFWTIIYSLTLYCKFFEFFTEEFLLWRQITSPVFAALWLIIDTYRLKCGKDANFQEDVGGYSNFVTMSILQYLFLIPNFFGYDVKPWETVFLAILCILPIPELIFACVQNQKLIKINTDRFYMDRYVRRITIEEASDEEPLLEHVE
ncbi:uncharacterized protein MONOS_18614 [Monocercomonoides exilis]|uniref:uncharacterized protein n=1 Tax=Monocercomonoides exilis TaxID=2049356 RepID=UPI00355AC22A|nr:hypothetical protein MONOS_18614 [Monocercomonoides exilis]